MKFHVYRREPDGRSYTLVATVEGRKDEAHGVPVIETLDDNSKILPGDYIVEAMTPRELSELLVRSIPYHKHDGTSRDYWLGLDKKEGA